MITGFLQTLFGVLLYYILFVQRLWMAPASKGALLNIHYYYYYYHISVPEIIAYWMKQWNIKISEYRGFKNEALSECRVDAGHMYYSLLILVLC